ncbi:MAG: response regulator [Xenococcaceae cyanobacterium]
MQFTFLDTRYQENSSQIPVVESQIGGKYRLGNMSNFEEILVFAEELIYEKIGNYFSDLQRTILMTTLQGSRKTYDQIAAECGYSPKYVKQDIAPKLWQLLSQALERKITKSNVKAILEHQMRHQPLVVESPSPVALSPVPSADEKGHGRGNILLVDDRPQNLKLLSDLLEEQGYEVQQAINGLVALQAIARACPDVILLDINMPELDGYSVCQRLKANPQTQEIPVIFVSAFDEAWDKVKAFSVGGSDYITKPFKTVEVLARVENQLKVRRLQLQLQEKNRQLEQALQKLEKITAKSEPTNY